MRDATATTEFNEVFWTAIRRVYGRMWGGANQLAADGNTTVKAATKYLDRSRVAPPETLLALMLTSPEINDALFSAVRARLSQTEQRIEECRLRREGARAVAMAIPDPGGAAGMGGGRVRGGSEQGDVGGRVGNAQVQAVTAVGVCRRVAK